MSRLPHTLGLALLTPCLALAQGQTPPPAPPAAPTGALPPSPPPGPPPSAAPSVAPSAAPSASAPPAPPPGYAPPPSGYAYPPPGYGYPPYYYPPPPGYYGWGAPPRPKPQYPEDAAGQTSPFLDMLVAGVAADKRYDHFFTVGAQGGVYLGARFRVVARVLLFTSEPDDDVADNYYGDEVVPPGYQPVASDPPVLLIGGVIGVAPVVRRNFVFAPGIGFHTTNTGAYGSMLTLAMPFEWVTDDGARFGFEIDIGRAFGGRVTGVCETATSCILGDEQEFDRPAAPAFLAAFEIGWGFNHPPAKIPENTQVR